MFCTINDIQLSFDKDNRLKSVINDVAGADVTKLHALAAFFNRNEFIEYVKEHISKNDCLKDFVGEIKDLTKNDLVNVKKNVLKKLINDYYKTNYKSVTNSSTKIGMGRLLGFTSTKAKHEAKMYVANLIIRKYIDEINTNNRKRNKDFYKNIIKSIHRDIETTFIDRVSKYCESVISNETIKQNIKDKAKEFIDLIKQGNELKSEVENISDNAKALQATINALIENNNTKSEQYKNATNEYNRLKTLFAAKNKQLAELKIERYNLAQVIANNYTDASIGIDKVTLLNYANLINQIKTNADEFFFEVYNTKTMTNVSKLFEKTGSIEEFIEEEDGNNDTLENQFNNETVDETAKTWEDNLYNNYTSSVSTKIKLILSNVAKLSQPYNENSDVQAIDTNNELGVETYIDSRYLISQIYANADVSNIYNFINSLNKKSKTVKSLYGLGTIVARMKSDAQFANYIYVNFAKPIVHKVTITINDAHKEQGINFDYSNNNAFPFINLVFNIINNIKANYETSYNKNDLKKLIDINKLINDYESNKKEIVNTIKDVISSYIPTFNNSIIDLYFNDSNITTDNIKELINNLYNLITELGKYKDKISKYYKDRRESYNIRLAKYNYDMEQYEKGNIKDAPEYPVIEPINYSIYDFSKSLNQDIISIANKFINYSESIVNLNSKNAKGSMSSDVIKNCFVTRFFDQIMSGNEKDSDKGLKELGKYLIQGIDENGNNQYSNNPLFFGIKDYDGNIVIPGMFTIVNGEAIPNSNAKELLKYNLFDGLKNADTSLGQVYEEMSADDFFISQFIMFTNSLNDLSDGTFTTKVNNISTGVYTIRIGSDSPKIFTIKAPKYTNENAKLAIYNHVLDELNIFVNAINSIFIQRANGEFTVRRDITNLFGRFHFDENEANKIKDKKGKNYISAIVKNGRLVGNAFKFTRLENFKDFNASEQIEQLLSLYGGGPNSLFIETKNGLKLNMDRINTRDFISFNGDKFVLNLNDDIINGLRTIVENWSTHFINYGKEHLNEVIRVFNDTGVNISEDVIENYLLNYYNMNLNYDDMFEGDYKFYKNSRDFFKRMKEAQAGGESYSGYDSTINETELVELEWYGDPQYINVKQAIGQEESQITLPVKRNGILTADSPMIARNGFRAITIYNTVRPSDYAEDIEKSLYDGFIKDGMSKKKAKERATKLAKGYYDNTKTNDAQSYITLEEFIRRKYADGTLNEYQDLLAQILDPNVSAEEINLDEINARIQIQKNFYYDKVFDTTTGVFYPRQIKNAEFVIIPKLLPSDSSLRKIYDFMIKNDIGQLNTAETDKSAKKNILEIFDNDGNLIEENLKDELADNYVQTYYYKYLYKQQDVPQHIEDEENKLGSQISKKILDNISNSSEEIKQAAKEYQEAITENIREDFYSFLEIMGWEYDEENHKIINKDYSTTDKYGNRLPEETIQFNREKLQLNRLFSEARKEAARLGMNSNFIEYLIPNEFGQPNISLAMNTVLFKLQSIINSLYNKNITRQTLPGWHSAQITGVGYSKKLKFDAETGVMEIRIPRWSHLIPRGKNAEEDAAILKQIEEEGLDIQLAYRIPTEGKQSISTIKIVGFVNDCLGSTVVVPDDWVTQTGSDFDVDSIYAIVWEMYKDSNGKLRKILYKEEDVNDETLYISYVQKHLDNRIKVDNIGNEIEDSIKELRDSIKEKINRIEESNEEIKQISISKDNAFKKINRKARQIVAEINKQSINNNGKVDITIAYPRIIDALNNYINNSNLTDIEVENINFYLAHIEIIVDILDELQGIHIPNKKEFKLSIKDIISKAKENAKNKFFEDIKNAAKELGLLSFEEFSAQPIIKKLGKRARNNYILDRMLQIQNASFSREEQYMRSQFEGITNSDGTGGNNVVDKLYGIEKSTTNPYNPIHQLSYMDDAMSGARMKALSVNYDTLASRCNYTQMELNAESSLTVEVVVGEKSVEESEISYDEETIDSSYDYNIKENKSTNKNAPRSIDVTTQKEINRIDKDNNFTRTVETINETDNIIINQQQKHKRVIITLNKFGWSKNNRNIIGELITPYTSQTTAHHLDAIKEGSIPNVNEFTFGVYKYLTCIGLDHEFAIAFIRQPIITKLVTNYKRNKSIFFKNDENVISKTIKEIFIGKNTYTVSANRKTNVVSENNSLYQVLNSIKQNNDFVNAFYRIFEVDISNINPTDLLTFNISLNKELLFRRIKDVNLNNINPIYRDAYDFGIIILFNRMKKTANKLSDIITISSIDKVGAKTETKETRVIKDLIDEYRKDIVLHKSYSSYADLIFPITNGNLNVIDVDKSIYPSMAANYAYSTIPSIESGANIFETETDDVYKAIKEIEKIIGRKLTSTEYKELIKYSIAYLYNSISQLLSPLSVNERGNIIPFIDQQQNESTKPKTAGIELWDRERSRIYGYGVTTNGNFKCKDINNPTETEIVEFIKFTPAQKVLFIQKAFRDNPGIFGAINVTIYNNVDAAKRDGINRQYLNFNDEMYSEEDMFIGIINAFSNHNPLVKLTAIDLVKYSFIAEGFNFRTGYISKIIPNSVILNGLNDGGLDLIRSNGGLKQLLQNLHFTISNIEFIDNYIKSHSELAKQYNLNKKQSEDFVKNIDSDGLVIVINDNNYIISKLELFKNVGRYIKVTINGDNVQQTTLYTVYEGNPIYKTDTKGNIIRAENGDPIIKDYKDYYLIPLNKLDKYETYNLSYNPLNNKFHDVDYYAERAEYLSKIISSYVNSQYLKSIAENARSKIKAVIPTERRFTSSAENNKIEENIDFLNDISESNLNKLQSGAKKLITDIKNKVIAGYKIGEVTPKFILNNNQELSDIIPIEQPIIQNIEDDNGTRYSILITKISDINNRNGDLIRTINKSTEENSTREILDLKKSIEDTKTNFNRMTVYKVQVEPIRKESDDIMYAVTELIDDVENGSILSDPPRRGMRDVETLDRVTSSIMRQINYEYRKNSSKAAKEFIRTMNKLGASVNFRSSLRENVDDIYKYAARYYQSAANKILNALNSFTIGEYTYSLDNEEFYEVLSKNDQYFAEVAWLILDAVTFGNRIAPIFELNLMSEDKELAANIESIRNSINKVKNNSIAKQAMANIINIYFKKYATNPLIRDGILNIRDQFGDIDWIIKMIMDPAEINNQEVQTILKQIYGMISKSEMFDTSKNIKEYEDELAIINVMPDVIDMNKIIDSEKGMIVQDFNDKFLEDKQKVIDEYNDAKINRFESVDAFRKYLEAQLRRDKFMYENMEQPILDEYYKEDIANRETALRNGGKAYIEYRMLSAILYDINNMIDGDEDYINLRRQQIITKMNYLKSEAEYDGTAKEGDKLEAARAITNFIVKNQEINDKYFNQQEYDGFQDDYNRYNNIIKRYDAEHKQETLEEKLANEEYKEAYNWVKNNGKLIFTKEARDKLSETFKVLVARKTPMRTTTRAAIKAIPGAIDDAGIIDARVLNDEQLELLKQEEQEDYGVNFTNGDYEMMLIKYPSPSKKLAFRTKDVIKAKFNPSISNIITEINKILFKVVDRNTGEIIIPDLFNDNIVSNEERDKLAVLYNELYKLGLHEPNDSYEQTFIWEINKDAYKKALAYYHTELMNTRQGTQFNRIFNKIDENGNINANLFIFGYKDILDEFVDKEATDAYNFIQDNVEFVPTEYYYSARQEAINNGTFDEWFEKNHIYNPFTHRYRPLQVWTTIEAKPNSELSKQVEYIPSFDNIERSVKEEYINNETNRKRLGLNGKGYQEFSNNYSRSKGRYNRNIHLNKKEQAYKELIQKVLNKYATTYQGKKFVAQGYLPRERSTQVTTKWALGQFASLFGWSFSSGHDSDSFRDIIDYSHDKEADMNMLQLIKDKGSKQYLKLPNRVDFKTEKEYLEELRKVREENRKIRDYNLMLDNKHLNRNWNEVIKDFIHNATIFNATQATKPYMYLLLEDLANNNAYMIKGMWNKNLVKDSTTSTKDDTKYRTEPQERILSLMKNQARRILYSQYNEKSKARNIANLLQNLASAKYMVANVYGGIANVATGHVNIKAEEFANQFFGFNEFTKAEKQYLRHIHKYFLSSFRDYYTDLTTALIEKFKVVDFDQIIQQGAMSGDISNVTRQIRNYLYGMQSAGEHYMQNSVLLAMLKSNRLYTDSNGVRRIGDLRSYTWDLEKVAMMDILKSRPNLLENYKIYLNNIREYDLETRMKISFGQIDINRNFLNSLKDSDGETKGIYKTLVEEYYKKRKELRKQAEVKFKKNKTVESLFKLENGKAVIKQDIYDEFNKDGYNPIGDLEKLIAEFREKVISVNKFIHGVYDKNGAAKIEAKWFGSLLMQYHKHLPMGLLKRFRRKGYYNEFRGAFVRGTYQTLTDFLSTEFIGSKDRIKNKVENGTNIIAASLQVYTTALIDTIMNLHLNYKALNDNEIANMRRLLGEIGGILIACLIIASLFAFGGDDDEIGDSVWKSSCLYLADRLYSETTMYTPWGLISESKTLWSSPIAASSGPTDLFKAMQLITQWMFDPDFNPEYTSGRYAGENKFGVIVKRSSPGVRPIYRIQNIGDSNRYYKIGQSRIVPNIAKSFGEMLAE